MKKSKRLLLALLAVATSFSLAACGDVTKDKNFSHEKYDQMPQIDQSTALDPDFRGLWLSETDRVLFADIDYITDDFITVKAGEKKFSFLQTEDTRKRISVLESKGYKFEIGQQIAVEFDINEETGIMTATGVEFVED